MMDGIEVHWLWLIGAALLAVGEILAPGVFMIFLAAAAALTGVAAWAGLPLIFQLALFPILALGSVHVGRRWYSRHPVESSDPLLNDRLARYVGETVVVVAAIENGHGRVKLGDTIWPVRGEDAPTGAKVRIVGAEGGCLRVEPLPLLEDGR